MAPSRSPSQVPFLTISFLGPGGFAGLRGLWSMFPLSIVPFWYRFCEPQPNRLQKKGYPYSNLSTGGPGCGSLTFECSKNIRLSSHASESIAGEDVTI